MAARYPIWTFPRNTVCAIAPPIGAAAMLSRKDDSTNTITSSTNAPFQSRGRNLGSSAGTLLSSKCFDSSAKPSSRHRRLARMTHSWGRWASRPAMPSPALNPVKASLYRGDDRQSDQRHAEQRQRKQDEIERNAEHGGRSSLHSIPLRCRRTLAHKDKGLACKAGLAGGPETRRRRGSRVDDRPKRRACRAALATPLWRKVPAWPERMVGLLSRHAQMGQG